MIITLKRTLEKTLSLRSLKRFLSLQNLKKTLSDIGTIMQAIGEVIEEVVKIKKYIGNPVWESLVFEL